MQDQSTCGSTKMTYSFSWSASSTLVTKFLVYRPIPSGLSRQPRPSIPIRIKIALIKGKGGPMETHLDFSNSTQLKTIPRYGDTGQCTFVILHNHYEFSKIDPSFGPTMSGCGLSSHGLDQTHYRYLWIFMWTSIPYLEDHEHRDHGAV